LLIPKEKHFLLGLPDEDLVARAVEKRDGYAVAILQERQLQDRVFVNESGGFEGRLNGNEQTIEVLVRQRIKWRRKELRTINKVFSPRQAI